MTKKKHVHFEITTPNGNTGMIRGDPGMDDKTKAALGSMLDAAAKMLDGKWNPVKPGFEPFWGIVSQSGQVIAPRVASERLAKQICDEHNSQVDELSEAHVKLDEYGIPRHSELGKGEAHTYSLSWRVSELFSRWRKKWEACVDLHNPPSLDEK